MTTTSGANSSGASFDEDEPEFEADVGTEEDLGDVDDAIDADSWADDIEAEAGPIDVDETLEVEPVETDETPEAGPVDADETPRVDDIDVEADDAADADREDETEAEQEHEDEGQEADEDGGEAIGDASVGQVEHDDAEANEPPSPPLAPPAPVASSATASDEWTTRQLASVLSRAAVICLALALIGFGLGFIRGGTNVARAEFVYTLDQSVPDSFLREDRRLLTQVATFTSDAVLVPVASQFDLDVDDLRDSIGIETVALSEVLRLEVGDTDAGRALALNRAVLDQYLLVITAAAPAGDSLELGRQRDEVLAELAEADRQRRALTEASEQDAVLDVGQDSIQRQIDLTRDRTAALQGLADDTLVANLSPARQARLDEELAAARAQLTSLEDELAVVVGERAELATATTTEPALLREVARLESRLATIDEELSQRELGPLVASPIRELSEPTVVERSAVRSGLQGAALATLLAVPVATWAAYRTRRRQLWFG